MCVAVAEMKGDGRPDMHKLNKVDLISSSDSVLVNHDTLSNLSDLYCSPLTVCRSQCFASPLFIIRLISLYTFYA